MKRRTLVREAQREGWKVEVLGSGHLKLTHPEATRAVVIPAMPSDWRGDRNAKADMKRALLCSVEADKIATSVHFPPGPSHKRRPRPTPEPALAPPPVIMTGAVREQGTRRRAGHVGGMAAELVLEEGDDGRRWRLTLTRRGQPWLLAGPFQSGCRCGRR
jgi:predicted RNA binding protein YcfA (HicA-like mRNA interferase family)